MCPIYDEMASLLVEKENAVDREQIDKSLFSIVDFQEISNPQQDNSLWNVSKIKGNEEHCGRLWQSTEHAFEHKCIEIEYLLEAICFDSTFTDESDGRAHIEKNNTFEYGCRWENGDTFVYQRTTHTCCFWNSRLLIHFTFWAHAHRISYVSNENYSDWNVCRTLASSKHVDKPSFEFSFASHLDFNAAIEWQIQNNQA